MVEYVLAFPSKVKASMKQTSKLFLYNALCEVVIVQKSSTWLDLNYSTQKIIETTPLLLGNVQCNVMSVQNAFKLA